jgi:hypothetical protein
MTIAVDASGGSSFARGKVTEIRLLSPPRLMT